MRNKKIVIGVVALLILFSLTLLAETKKLEQIGRYTFVRIKGEVPTEEVMKILLDKYAGDIKYGFDLAGYGDLFLPFMDQLKAANFEKKELPVGEHLMWMLFRSRGKIKIVQDLEWAGKNPLPVFSFMVVKGYKHYEFIMPAPCGNISLRKVEEIIPEAICDLKVSPAKANINDPISVDMSGTQHAKSMEVDIVGPDGTKIETKSLTPDNPKFQTKLSSPGDFSFKGRAINPEGKVSTNPCEAKVYINYPPVCKLWTSCLPCKDYVGRPVTIDASQSTDPDGEVVKADFEITDEAGNRVDSFSDSEKPFTWEKIFTKPGLYTITGIVTDDFGAVSEPAKIEVEVTEKRSFFLIEGGPLIARGSAGPYVAARAGLLYKVVPGTLDFVISGGGSLALKGDPWKSFFMANVLMNVRSGPAFFGAGAGFATKVREERNADAELIGQVGYEMFNNFINAGSLFFEVRAPVGEGRSFSKHYKLMLGFRFIF
ncbi:MAG TPA: hypothetical protein ENF17_09160 [Candidatus Aminicenantes bacterium]|nr:hypothetical protein [Candidatus Aminicenantes bacterium]